MARLRQAALDAARQSLADALRAEGVLQEERRGVMDDLSRELDDRQSDLRTIGCDPTKLLASQRYESALRARLSSIDDNAAKVAEEVARRQLAVAEARRQTRVIELLNERAERRHRLEAERAESRVLDEHAARRHRDKSVTVPPHHE